MAVPWQCQHLFTKQHKRMEMDVLPGDLSSRKKVGDESAGHLASLTSRGGCPWSRLKWCHHIRLRLHACRV